MSNENISTYKLKEFKSKLKNSLFLNPEDIELFEQIPEEYFSAILKNNFNGDLQLSKQILFEEYKEIDSTDIRKSLCDIYNYDISVKTLSEYIEKKKPIVFVTDIDNDGSLSQSILFELKRILGSDSDNIDIIYSQVINGNSERGFTVDLLETWAKYNNFNLEEDFLMLTADNGINSRNEQLKILNNFTKCKILITDHHLPDGDNVVLENDRTIIFNPKYKPNDYFKSKYNISGAHTLGVLCEGVLQYFDKNVDLRNMHNLESVSNLLDYVKTDIRLKPLENYLIDQSNSLGSLLNINNSTSMLITQDIKKEDINSIVKQIDTLDKEIFVNALLDIKEQNVHASKLLQLNFDFKLLKDDVKKVITSEEFYRDYLNILVSDRSYSHFNNNYIEQLRPHIYFMTTNGNKGSYEVELLEKMKDVFSKVKLAERKLINEMKDSDIMEVISRPNVSIMYPKYPEITRLFNRKFLSKAFNLANPGFQAILSSFKENEWNGSFRGLYDASELSENKHNLSNINFRFQGHERAAGLYIGSENGVNHNTIESFADYMNEEVERLKLDEEYDEKFILMDFENFNIIKEINGKVKSHVNNVSGINPVIKLSRSLFFNDKETLKPVSVGQMLKKSRFGYTTVSLNFHGDTIIVATEILRQLEQNNFKDLLQLTYLSDGAFIANRVIPINSLKRSNIVKLVNKSKEKQDFLSNYYEEEFQNKNTFTKSISRDQLKNIELFKRQYFGEKSFERVEELFIQIIDHYNLDKYVILDTEANGLGKAPKLFNFGALDVNIKKDSGDVYTSKEWAEILNNPIKRNLMEKSLKNIKYDEKSDTIIVNREIEATLMTALLHDRDFKLTQDIISLTGITQAMLNKYGVKPADFDLFLVEHYKDSKIVFQAHNANYDIGVLNSSAPKFKIEIIDNNLVCDSARFAKEQRLGYSDVSISVLGKNWSTAFFFDDPHVSYSLTTFLKETGDMKFPDIRGEFFLKRKNNEYFMIDIKNNIETALDMTSEDLLSKKSYVDLPLNRVKYSVVTLLKQDNIRNMLLNNVKGCLVDIETPEILKEYDELFQIYCNKNNYSFDMSPVNNFKVFEKRMKKEKRTEELDKLYSVPVVLKTFNGVDSLVYGNIKELSEDVENFGAIFKKTSVAEVFTRCSKHFIQANIDIYEKYVTAWEYVRVLESYDPNRSVITKDQVSGLSYKTGLPEERIKTIVQEIYQYKKELGIKEDFFVPELHNNIDVNGDAPLEGMAVFLRLVTQVGIRSLDIVVDTIEDTTRKNVVRTVLDNEAGRISQNSYSAQQYKSFSNRRDSDGNLAIAPSIDHAKNNPKLQFQSKLIPSGTHVIGKTKPKEELTFKELKDVEDKFNLLLMIGMIRGSSRDISFSKLEENLSKIEDEKERIKLVKDVFEDHKEATNSIDVLLDNAKSTSEVYNSELNELFGSMHFSREEAEIKRYCEDFWVILKSNMTATEFLPDYYKREHNAIYQSVIDKYEKMADLLGESISKEMKERLSKHIDGYVSKEPSSLTTLVDAEKRNIFKTIVNDYYPLLKITLQKKITNCNDLIELSGKKETLSSNGLFENNLPYDFDTHPQVISKVQKVLSNAKKLADKAAKLAEKEAKAAEKAAKALEPKKTATKKPKV